MTRPPAAVPPTVPPTRMRELDLLRFVAVGFVVLHHFAGVRSTVWAGRDAQKIYPELAGVAHFGYLGVQLVFMISGFVILMAAWGRNAGDFAVARVVRLYPAYWVSVLVSLTLYLVCGSAVPYADGADPVRRVLPNLTMLQEGMHVAPLEVVYWALWVELHFYVLIALFARVGITYARCVTFMVSWLIIGAFAKEGGSRLTQDVFLPETAPFFIAGMAFFLLHRFGSNIALWLVVAASWALSVHYLVDDISPLNAWKGVHEIVIPVVVTVFYAVMGLAAFGRLSWLRWRLLTVLGGLAYPLYLLHETEARAIVTVFFPHPFLDRWTILPVIVVAVFASAAAAHWLVERPVQALMRPRLAAAMAQIRGGGARPAEAPAEAPPRVVEDGPPGDGERPRRDAPAVPPASVP